MPPDPHDEPHRIVGIYPVVGTGWAVVVRQSASDRHQSIELTFAAEGGPMECLDCSVDETPHDPDQWGVSSGRVAEMVAHAVWHAATGTPPGECPEVRGDA